MPADRLDASLTKFERGILHYRKDIEIQKKVFGDIEIKSFSDDSYY